MFKIERVKRILLILFIFLLFLSILFLLYYFYEENNRKIKENNEITKIQNDINHLKNNIKIDSTLEGNKLNINIDNIGDKDILGIRFYIEFKNVFGEELIYCEDSCITKYDYSTKLNIDSQKEINKGESLSINKILNFGKRKGKGISFSIDEYSSSKKIKINKLIIYEAIFSNYKHIDLKKFCNNYYSLSFKYSNLTSDSLCEFN